ncbi:tetratricopeptide repeat protein [Persicimonas caeni]|uniref:Tetratricopeptide repeat protein n=1 Tax=Persicimonas caeni TaxID=2292766 RepID=A0A4Y6PQ93_PERCE|nr:tetratricopeptide repeat protein [Persicimonas caeni]QDG50383.1 tetratricopeptide repeat protein [Persicimonas caeni]QED31604.1 AAA family ATPase [Persicimonas caeni]
MQEHARKEQLFELQKAWAVALSGRPRIVFVDGPDAVGKRALVNSFLDMIRDQKTTDKRPLVGRGSCFEIGGWSEPLRVAWDGLAGLLEGRASESAGVDFGCLSAVSELSAVVPDAHISRVGTSLASVVCDDSGHVRIPRDKYLASPEILIRDSLLTLASEYPVALFLDELELADAATLTLLANLVDVLWEQDQPFYFMLVLAHQPELARSRGVLERLEDHLERHDRPNNRIIARVSLKGEQTDVLEVLDELDELAHEVLSVASLQGRRFSAATVASATGHDELAVMRTATRLCERGILRTANGPAPFDYFGHGVFEFASPRVAAAVRRRVSVEERRLLHGRIANHLLLQRSKLRDGRERLDSSSADRPDSLLTDKFARDADKLDAALRSLNLMLAEHLVGAERWMEAPRFLADTARELEKPARQNDFEEAEQARQTVWLTHLAEQTLLSLMRVQPRNEPADTMRAAFDVATIAATCRTRMGCYATALSLLERALEFARWMEDRELEIRALGRKLGALYRSGQHDRARALFEEVLDQYKVDATPWHIIEVFRTFQQWEHPDVSVRRLEALAETFEQLGRQEIADAAYTLVLRAHAEMLFERFETGELGHSDLADVIAEAEKHGFGGESRSILLEKFEEGVREELVRHGWFHLQSRERLALVRAAIELLERSRRMRELFELCRSTSRTENDTTTADRAKIGYARVFALWRARAQTVLETWDAAATGEEPAHDEKPIANLRRELLTGRLDHNTYFTALREGIDAADRQKMRREAIALRSRLAAEGTIKRDKAERILAEVEQLVSHADDESLKLYVMATRLRMARGDADTLEALDKRAEATAAKYYARAADDDRIWLASIAAEIAETSGRDRDRDAWFKHQVRTLGRARPDAPPAPFEPLDLVEAAREARSPLPDAPSVRSLIEAARDAHADGDFDLAIEKLDAARTRAPMAPEAWPAARELEEELSLAWEAKASNDADAEAMTRAIDALSRSVDYSRKLGQFDVAVESLGRAVQLARRNQTEVFWDLHAELRAMALELGSVDQVDRAFDISFDLLARSQRRPVFGESEPLELEDALEEFVANNTRMLRRIGAGSLLSKWDAMLAQVIEQTKQIPGP